MKTIFRFKITSSNSNNFMSLIPRHTQSPLIIYILITVLIILSTFSCGKVEEFEQPIIEEENIVTELEVDSKMRFKMHMSDLEDYYDYLAEAIEKQTWEEIQEYAILMKNTSPVVLTGQRKEELPRDFTILDTKYHLHTLKLVEAAKAREMVQLNIEFEKVKQTCDDCHERYKKKED